MSHRVFAHDCAVVFTCDDKKCQFTNEDQAVVAQHEHDAHGPAGVAADELD
ncbi:hypothetical protein [Saccharopolyspora phatthalungensis]|uniref:DUF1059 domain-containing protein n=1 Tax=Saccharopolyspora phatthalungensis TaxID=664693 RepID=A0A840Q857_9PSEU|nr:hypothetical protein [Saccharopolyspora phatthalungensis]MBB5156117.1 hypothetical protein [Saccharopolyspora phatthalungensis]